ncbi:MAG: metallophosphoesterase [Nitrospira sp.]|nr:metallophosphoesterase [Nitrospira sp.]MDH4242709.1 metallophosphoesterase [Nitrospira sp.]MDH4355022.1 metallophosphoesterase [Nitrospira sp.]MDH5316992.1 metallophosphoesterase [Nitrospira sp.]
MQENHPHEPSQKDLGIVHITDLHFPPNANASLSWTNAFLSTISDLAKQEILQLYAIAVTGDLVDSPDSGAFHRAHEFLKESLKKAGIVRNGLADMTKLWVVDGNHDWKVKGWCWNSSEGGIKETGGIERLSLPFCSEDGKFVSFGLNSGKGGIKFTSRGVVEVDELQSISDSVTRLNHDSSKQHRLACRIALVHHHVIPLPLDPDRKTPLAKVVNDESTKLLGNAGQVSAVLMKAGVNLVLHGHEHFEFVARLGHDRAGSYKNYFMTISAAPQASKGFHLIRFKPSGNVELEKYGLSSQVAYEKNPTSVSLWTNEEWQASIWGRISKDDGYYEKMTLRSYLNRLGDLDQVGIIEKIRAGQGKAINSLMVRIKGEGGLSWLDNANLSDSPGKTACDPLPMKSTAASREIYEGPLPLKPEATYDVPHPGYRSEVTIRNSFSMTMHDVKLRNASSDEHITIHSQHHVRELLATIKFPRRLAPAKLGVKVYSSNGQPDFAETSRANSCFDYDPENGVGCFRIFWVRSGDKFRFEWRVPEESLSNAAGGHYLREIDRISTEWSNSLFVQDIKDPSNDLNKLLLTMRDDLKNQYPDKVSSSEDLNIGIFALHRIDNLLKIVGGTYSNNSPMWKFSLKWGTGIAGSAMRRGYPWFYHSENKKDRSAYVEVPGCPPDVYILAFPIIAPLAAYEKAIPQQDQISSNFYKAVLCVHTSSISSGLDRLHHEDRHNERVRLALSLPEKVMSFFLNRERRRLGKS